MKIVIAPDSFKECLDAFAVAEAVAAGLRRAGVRDEDIVRRPLADGGDGLLHVLHHALGGQIRTARVCGPLGKPVNASFGLLDDGSTAVIEMAQAAGLHLTPVKKRDPRITTTRGVGELMRHAIDSGAQRIIVGLGGSATNDGGAGMAAALGIRFKDSQGRDLPPGGAALSRLASVDMSGRDTRLDAVEVAAACDVSNPLCGRNGASYVYAPQKGATPDMVKQLDAALRQYARVLKKERRVDVNALPGGGAAGGLAAGLAAFTGATLRSGVELVCDAYGDLDALIRDADIVISGEGAVDGQSAQGKVIAGLAQKARAHNTPLVVIAGKVGNDLDALYKAGVTAALPITPEPMAHRYALKYAARHLEQTGYALGRLAAALRKNA